MNVFLIVIGNFSSLLCFDYINYGFLDTLYCIPCQSAKVHLHKCPLFLLLVPEERFTHVHIDVISPLPLVHRFRYCPTMIYRFARWPDAVHTGEMTDETVAQDFTQTWVFCFGTPQRIT